jgi:uncharacterized membrane protein YphA (DoxX/SURF4 family)
MFLVGGADAVREPEPKAALAAHVVEPTAAFLGVEIAPASAVRLNGLVQVGAGTLLAFGIIPRVAAAVLAGSIIPTTLAGHRFWEAEEGESRQAQEIHFLKNLAMLAGLILAAVDTEGRPSLTWRAEKMLDSHLPGH